MLLKRRLRQVRREQIKAELKAQRRHIVEEPGRQMTCDRAVMLYHKLRDKFVVSKGDWASYADALKYGGTTLIVRDPQEGGGWLTAYWRTRVEDEYQQYRRMTFEEFCAFFKIQIVV